MGTLASARIPATDPELEAFYDKLPQHEKTPFVQRCLRLGFAIINEDYKIAKLAELDAEKKMFEDAFKQKKNFEMKDSNITDLKNNPALLIYFKGLQYVIF